MLALSEESVTVETFGGGWQDKLLDYETIFKGDHRTIAGYERHTNISSYTTRFNL